MRNNDPLSLSEVLKNTIEKNRWEYGINKVEAHEIWKNLMGNGILRYTSKVELRGETLYVGIESDSLRQELSYGTEKIIKMMNEEFGKEVIKKLVWQ